MVSQFLKLFPYALHYEWSRRPALYRSVIVLQLTGQVMWRSSWCKKKRHAKALAEEFICSRAERN